MGITGVGKSTFIQYFTDDIVEVGGSLESCKLITTHSDFFNSEAVETYRRLS